MTAALGRAASAALWPLEDDEESPVAPSSSEAALLNRLRCGDETAFQALVKRHHSAMVRVAMAYVPSRAIAEEVTQETWLAVIEGLDRFEGRSTLKTWIFRILVNRAKSRGMAERRCVTFSALADDDGPAVDPDRFLPADDPDAGRWAVEPRPFPDAAPDGVLSAELATHIASAIDALPPRQRQVIVLRDVAGCTSPEACAALGLSETNQRVLLHRARSAVRAALERYVEGSA
ncbi:MAG: sigma-70 family RNA polymerase sigma factor [Actinomycetota bacterium]|jgi:RNA polymerase sigma-70 factor, ECF subfamily